MEQSTELKQIVGVYAELFKVSPHASLLLSEGLECYPALEQAAYLPTPEESRAEMYAILVANALAITGKQEGWMTHVIK